MASQLPPESSQTAVEQEGGRMSFFDHLNELRKRLFYSAAAVALGAFIGVYYAPKVMGLIAAPIMDALKAAHLEERLYFTSPTGGINMIIKVGLYLGLVIASPIVLYQVWLFI